VVTQDGGKTRFADIFFFKGNISRAKFKQLTGDDAVFQLFQSPLEGEFSFTGRNVTEEEVQTEVTMPGISLLMESVRLQDELPMLQTRIPEANKIWKQKAAQLQWDDPDTLELAVAIWSRLKKGASMTDLLRDVPRCSYYIYRAVIGMVDAGQVE
jgi:hypothetical protein